MSFYGNILNRLEAFFNSIIVKNDDPTKLGGTIEASRYGANALNIKGTNGMILGVVDDESNDNEPKTLAIDGSNFITGIKEIKDGDETNALTYQFTYGDGNTGTFSISVSYDENKKTLTLF